MMKSLKKYWATVLILFCLYCLYKYCTDSGIANPYLFPTVDSIKKAFVNSRGVLWLNLIASFKLMIPAILLSLAISLVLGTILGLHEKLRDALHPIIYIFSVVPSILLSPFALLIAPTFWVASLFLIIYGTIWSTLFATITGIMTIDKRYLEKADTLEIYGLKRFLLVILPAASPSILSGFVNSLRGTFIMLVYSEMYGSQYGMGFFVKKYSEFGLYDRTWAGFLFLVLVLVLVMQAFEKVKKRILRWTM